MPEASPFRYEQAADSPGLLLWRLTSMWQARIAEALKPFALTQTQCAILASLRWFEEHGEQPTQRHLVEHARIDKMTLSKAIRSVERAGLVARQPAPADARATQVRFLARGRRVIANAIVAVEDADEQFFSSLGAKELQTWMALSNEVVRHSS